MGIVGGVLGAGLAGGSLAGGLAFGLANRPENVDRVGVNGAHFQYGGNYGQDDIEKRRYGYAGNAADARTLDQSAANGALGRAYGAFDQSGLARQQAQEARGLSMQSRAQQAQMIGQLQQAAAGNGPSVAAQQLQQGQASAAQNALNVAATSRGGGGANAALGAMDANVRGAAQANAQAAQVRVQEQQQARGDLMGMLQQQRQGDMALGAQDMAMGGQDIALGQANLQAMQGAQAGSGLSMQQQAQNDAMRRFYEEGTQNVNNSALNAQMQLAGANLQSGLQAQNINAQQKQAYMQQMMGLFGAGVAGGGAAMSGGFF